MPICTQCQREFYESGATHTSLCSSCRAPKYPCPVCGKIIRTTSATCWECRNDARSANGNWRGGKTRHWRGYVLVRVPEHPRAPANRGYVFEHILIMEDHLGRHLKAPERVHHKNGLKDDNRPQNLELWTGDHPSGCRVNDLLDWAIDFIEEYAPEKLTH